MPRILHDVTGSRRRCPDGADFGAVKNLLKHKNSFEGGGVRACVNEIHILLHHCHPSTAPMLPFADFRQFGLPVCR